VPESGKWHGGTHTRWIVALSAATEKHSRCLTEKVYLPPIVCGRVLWHLGYTKHASMAAFTQSYQEFQRAAVQQEPTYQVRGILTDGFDSTTSRMRTLFPGARLGSIGKSNGLFHCLLRPPCRPLPATGTPPARQRWPLAQAAPAAWRGTAGVGAAGGLSNAEEGGLMQTRNAKGACFKRDKRSRD
jgi:hypothetical protein